MAEQTRKEEMLVALRERRADPPEKINNAKLHAGQPMFFYCISCDGVIIVPETYLTKPDLCVECTKLKKLGWLEE